MLHGSFQDDPVYDRRNTLIYIIQSRSSRRYSTGTVQHADNMKAHHSPILCATSFRVSGADRQEKSAAKAAAGLLEVSRSLWSRSWAEMRRRFVQVPLARNLVTCMIWQNKKICGVYRRHQKRKLPTHVAQERVGWSTNPWHPQGPPTAWQTLSEKKVSQKYHA